MPSNTRVVRSHLGPIMRLQVAIEKFLLPKATNNEPLFVSREEGVVKDVCCLVEKTRFAYCFPIIECKLVPKPEIADSIYGYYN